MNSNSELYFAASTNVVGIWLIAVASLILGIVLGKRLQKQHQLVAKIVEINTRTNQSRYDLAARDIIKTRQETTARLQQLSSEPTTAGEVHSNQLF